VGNPRQSRKGETSNVDIDLLVSIFIGDGKRKKQWKKSRDQI
jgi:hypothetical protein